MTPLLRRGAGAGLRERIGGGLRLWWRSTRPDRGERPDAQQPPARDLIYRLRTWPELADHQRNVDVYRMLSVMSSRPVNRSWVLSTTDMTEQYLDRLLADLIAVGAVDIIDPAQFPEHAN